MADTSRATAVAKLRCFLRTAYRRGWTKEPLREKVLAHRATYEEKQPYSDAEVKLILDEALELDGGTHGYAKYPKTFRLLLEVMLETGMRVGDAIRFNPKALTKGKRMWVYTYQPMKQKKTDRQKLVEAFIPKALKKALDECEWLSPELPFAYRAVAKEDETDYLAQAVYERMQAIGSRCGLPDCRPHRLRDTFAVSKLVGGAHLDDVSRLLGHSSDHGHGRRRKLGLRG